MMLISAATDILTDITLKQTCPSPTSRPNSHPNFTTQLSLPCVRVPSTQRGPDNLWDAGRAVAPSGMQNEAKHGKTYVSGRRLRKSFSGPLPTLEGDHQPIGTP